MTGSQLGLTEGIEELGISLSDLWTRCVAVGLSAGATELQQHIDSAICPDEHEHNIIAQALNDAFVESGGDHPVAYLHLYRGDLSE